MALGVLRERHSHRLVVMSHNGIRATASGIAGNDRGNGLEVLTVGLERVRRRFAGAAVGQE